MLTQKKTKEISNKNAFQYDAYCPLQWPSFLYTCPLPCMPPAMHTLCHAHSPAMHAPCHTNSLAMHVPCHAPSSATPPVNRIRGRCKNIIFPQLRLRSVKIMLPAVRTELGTPCLLAWSSAIWANLALRLLRSLYNHTLLILTKFKSELVDQSKSS